jgi:hypothetical protein
MEGKEKRIGEQEEKKRDEENDEEEEERRGRSEVREV